MTENEWIPLKYLNDSDVVIKKTKTGYESTEDSGKTWRQSTEEEIIESGTWDD